MALNMLAEQKGAPYDADGEWARSGNRNVVLWNELNELEYYKKEATAKSLGKEWYDGDFAPLLAKYDCSVDDKLRTVTEHIAFQIGKVLECHTGAQVLLTGGGALNKFLVESIQKETSKQVVVPTS
jgi:anhydro-N-acetylmuramic acid kinase